MIEQKIGYGLLARKTKIWGSKKNPTGWSDPLLRTIVDSSLFHAWMEGLPRDLECWNIYFEGIYIGNGGIKRLIFEADMRRFDLGDIGKGSDPATRIVELPEPTS